MVRDPPGIEEPTRDTTVDGEVDVLRDIVGHPGELDRVQLGYHHANHMGASIEQRATAVTRLHGGGDL